MTKRGRRTVRRLRDTWVDPKASVVRKVVDVWWSRWAALVVLPAFLVSGHDSGWWLGEGLILSTGCGVVRCPIPAVSASRRRRGPRVAARRTRGPTRA
jgi:hypothetical protein